MPLENFKVVPLTMNRVKLKVEVFYIYGRLQIFTRNQRRNIWRLTSAIHEAVFIWDLKSGLDTSIFQREIMAIIEYLVECTQKIMEKNYLGKITFIATESQAALRAPEHTQVTGNGE